MGDLRNALDLIIWSILAYVLANMVAGIVIDTKRKRKHRNDR